MQKIQMVFQTELDKLVVWVILAPHIAWKKCQGGQLCCIWKAYCFFEHQPPKRK